MGETEKTTGCLRVVVDFVCGGIKGADVLGREVVRLGIGPRQRFNLPRCFAPCKHATSCFTFISVTACCFCVCVFMGVRGVGVGRGQGLFITQQEQPHEVGAVRCGVP